MRFFRNLLVGLPAVLAAPIFNDAPVSEITDRSLQARAIADSWIVKVNKDANLASVITQVVGLAGVQAKHKYSFGDFKGFSLNGIADLPTLLASVANIEAIEQDTEVFASALTTQSNPPYGLARISHRTKGATDYVYDDSAGAGTFAYIIDTGIYTEHVDFGGRAQKGANFIEGESDADGNGHGTHVAGTTGSSTYGVAKKTTLIAVKVLSSEGSGSNSGVLAGIDWAANDAVQKGRVGKAVANLSLGGLFSPMTNQAAAAAVKQGLFLAVAAGNSGLPTITSSPASEVSVCTVGASDKDDKLASFSNFGVLVDIIAPGVNVTSTWIRSNTDTNTISGTSMATPHITGLGAYLLGLEGARTPAALCSRIQELSTKDALSLGVAGLLTKNYLAYNGNGA